MLASSTVDSMRSKMPVIASCTSGAVTPPSASKTICDENPARSANPASLRRSNAASLSEPLRSNSVRNAPPALLAMPNTATRNTIQPMTTKRRRRYMVRDSRSSMPASEGRRWRAGGSPPRRRVRTSPRFRNRARRCVHGRDCPTPRRVTDVTLRDSYDAPP